MLHYIIWNVDPELFRVGSWPVRWYGLLFASGFLLGVQIMTYIFKTERKPLADIDALLMIVVITTVLGARIGHFLFYEPAMFLHDPLRIITPPFSGLASHGATISVIVGLWLYSRRASSRATGQSFFWIIDRICIVGVLEGAFIRLGNLMNSEIFGKPTQVPWAFVFVRDNEFSQVPRHPTQLYETLSCLILFIGLFWYWKVYRNRAAPGTILGITLIWVFGLRFIWEFLKENQVAFEDTMSLNVGQLLSIPAVIVGLFLLLRNFFRPATLIPIALIIQSTSVCYRCEHQAVLPHPATSYPNGQVSACDSPIPNKSTAFQSNRSATKRSIRPIDNA